MKYILSEWLTYVDKCGKQSNSKVRESDSKIQSKIQHNYKKYITQIIITYQRL